MKIKSFKAYKKNLLLQKPYTIARETITDVENVFLEVELENGIKGIGAANPSPEVVGETPEQTLQNLQSGFLETLAGKDIRQFLHHIYLTKQQFPGRPGTQACIDIALHDAFTKWLGISLVDFYGRQHERMLTSVTIGIKDVAATLEEADDYYKKGFRILKIKTGLNAGLDADRIIKLKEKFGKHFIIRVDANTGYTLDDLKLFLSLTKAYDVELIEQPLLPYLDKELLQLPAETRAILAADESLKDERSALSVAAQNLYGIFNIKLMKCGGIKRAMEIANIANPAGIHLFWGCNDESIVSITAALHAAFACPHTKYIDLDGSLDLTEDVVTGGFILKDGYMYLDDAPGLGVSII
ncbi:mandelate racemase/muconate lactonizing enzyme family protein [Parafilimonas sp.]|uniref:mandelate racemase/muconate lactonizing enzyme family protein n=1 Tax=Parafilimonas sp. TaxID=1969739 RepID=UPI0039E672B2